MRVQVFAAALAVVFTGSAIAFAATGTRVQARPDLVVASLSNPPGVVLQGHTFQVHDGTRNRGRATAGHTVTQYYLTSASTGVRKAIGNRPVPRLRAGHRSLGHGTVLASSSLEAGTYSLVACADGGHAVRESNEPNNCRTAATTVVVKKPLPPV
ncbi:MAG TPA: CARDB domain-containing protein [Gaiellaceae bacterium]|nr:CARDB domain-containing protein [Gaiellaceae bacterium]